MARSRIPLASTRPFHGHASDKQRSPEYCAWAGMKARCLNPKNPKYRLYGGRGIGICPEWLKFPAFLRDVGLRPSPNHSIDRIDNNGHYEPGNVRWATLQEQNNNHRANRRLTFQGRTMTVREWAREHGLNYETLIARVGRLGWPIDRALMEPRRKPNDKKAEWRHQRLTEPVHHLK